MTSVNLSRIPMHSKNMRLFSTFFNALLTIGTGPERLKPDDLPMKMPSPMTAEERQRIDSELAIARRLEALRRKTWEEKMTSDLPADVRTLHG